MPTSVHRKVTTSDFNVTMTPAQNTFATPLAGSVRSGLPEAAHGPHSEHPDLVLKNTRQPSPQANRGDAKGFSASRVCPCGRGGVCARCIAARSPLERRLSGMCNALMESLSASILSAESLTKVDGRSRMKSSNMALSRQSKMHAPGVACSRRHRLAQRCELTRHGAMAYARNSQHQCPAHPRGD